MKTWKNRTIAAGFALCLAAGLHATDAPRQNSLYERLGGMPAIRAVVDDLMIRILADARINQWFAHAAADPARAAAYKVKLADLVCQSTGGPCQFGGDMGAAHMGRGITPEAFDAMVDDIHASLDSLKVPAKEQSDLMRLLAPLKAVVVQPAAK